MGVGGQQRAAGVWNDVAEGDDRGGDVRTIERMDKQSGSCFVAAVDSSIVVPAQ